MLSLAATWWKLFGKNCKICGRRAIQDQVVCADPHCQQEYIRIIRIFGEIAKQLNKLSSPNDPPPPDDHGKPKWEL